MPRLCLALAVASVVALTATPSATPIPRRYGAPPGSVSPILPVTTAAWIVIVLVTVLALHLAVDIVLLLAGKRSLADRLAGTQLTSTRN
jgi:hypothetical protein